MATWPTSLTPVTTFAWLTGAHHDRAQEVLVHARRPRPRVRLPAPDRGGHPAARRPRPDGLPPHQAAPGTGRAEEVRRRRPRPGEGWRRLLQRARERPGRLR